MSKDLLLIGQIAKAHGIRGELCLNYYAEQEDLLNERLWLGADISKVQEIKVSSHSFHKNQVIIKIKGIDDRTKAELYRDYELYIESDKLPELSDDEIYIYELMDLEVYMKISDEFQLLGHIEDVLYPAGQELWQIRGVNDEELLFPAVTEFILKFDLENRKVFIDPPDGLFD